MKKTFLCLAAVFISIAAMAEIEILSVETLRGTGQKGYYFPRFSVQGDQLYLTKGNYKGLVSYDLNQHSQKVISSAENIGFEPQFSTQGKVIVYRDVTYENNLRFTSIKMLNTETGQISQLDAPARDVHAFRLAGGEVRIATPEHIITKRVTSETDETVQPLVLSIEDKNLVLYNDKVRKVINPAGDQSYIWPSLSPDQKHIVFTAISLDGNRYSTYVCDIDGRNLVNLGYIGAPQWLGNDRIVGMLDLWSDGHTYTHSPIVSVKTDGSEKQVLDLPDHEVILYPAVSPQGDKIAFESKGAIHVMNIRVR